MSTEKTEILNIEELKQDIRNFNTGTEAGAKLMRKSFEQFGAGRSVLIDRDNNIIAGNKSQKAAIEAGIKRVRIIETDGSELIAVRRTDIDIDSREGRELALADNATQQVNLAWDKDVLQDVSAEFGFSAEDWNVQLPDMTFDAPENEEDEEETIERKRREFEQKMQDGELSEDDPEYQEFLKKFEAKRTTDDCYTPAPVYDAVAEWVAKEYGVSPANFVRPFYPGGDYQRETYKPTDIVVDNPPFSIFSKIIRFYNEKGVRFFLFAPSLTMFSSSSSCAICVGVSITYENKATVFTSFITNMEDGIRARTAPELYKMVEEANDKYLDTLRTALPKYSYPDNIITSAFMAKLSKYGQDFKVRIEESELISILDMQKERQSPGIFGKGYIIGTKAAAEKAAAEKAAAEKAAAEKAAATRWQLSDREKTIIAELDRRAYDSTK